MVPKDTHVKLKRQNFKEKGWRKQRANANSDQMKQNFKQNKAKGIVRHKVALHHYTDFP